MRSLVFYVVAGSLLSVLAGCPQDETQPSGDDDQTPVATPTPATDADQDGYPAATDCDDNDATINPSAVEVCDGVDNNCDGSTDEGFPMVDYYLDQDQDGYGDSSVSDSGCGVPDGYADVSGDCNDNDASINPEAEEITCNGLDENCNGDDDDSPDVDGDGYDICDENVAGSDGLPADCDDTDYTDNPGAAEVCDGLDNDCDGEIDEDLEIATYYYDADNDGYGTPDNTIEACGPTSDYVAAGNDCDDADPTIHPGAIEFRGDGVDSDCDGYNDYVITLSSTDGPGYSGDGGPIGEAQFDAPHGIAVDREGITYIADTNNNAIRRIDLDGTVTTLIGGEDGSGDGGGDTLLAAPTGLATDGANLYIADTGHHRILQWSASDGLIVTVAGTGEAGYDGEGLLATSSRLNSPMGVAISASLTLYIADTGNDVVRQVNLRAKSPSIITIAGKHDSPGYGGDGGPATAASLDAPQGVAVDSTGNTVYIADTGNHVIREVKRDDTIVLVAGTPQSSGFDGDTGSALWAMFDTPTCVMTGATSDVFVCDAGNNRIRQITPAGNMFTLAGNGDDSSMIEEDNASAVDIASPSGIAFDSQNDLWISDTGHSWMRKLMY